MKPYTLEAFKAGKKAKYRNDDSVLHVFHVPEYDTFISVDALGAKWQHEDGDGSDVCGNSNYDLIIDEPDEIEHRWVNRHSDHFGEFGTFYSDLESAKRVAEKFGTIEIWHLKFNITQGTGTMEVVKY